MTRFVLAFVSTLAAAPTMAQTTAEGPAPTPPPATTDAHGSLSQDIVVTALTRNRLDVLSGVSVLQGAELTQSVRPSLGETLARQPGVSATSFGPSASRPVLRGFQGERVSVLTDGIGSIDASSTSADHAVVIDPLLAERIEILRGPQSLLYGSSAIGGVVNVIDRRIPRSVPTEPFHLGAVATYGSAANEREAEASLDAPVSDILVLHADASYRRTGNQRIGGYALTPALRAQALASSLLPPDPDADPEVDFAANAAVRGELPNTQSETWTAGLGAALITDHGNVGFVISHYDSLYGVPVRFATAPGEAQEAPRLDVAQNRVDIRGEVRPGGFIEAIRARFGAARYRHFELEEDNSIGTAFYNRGLEGRIELVQAQRGAWSGATGVQYLARDFNVIGEEAFLPRSETSQLGLFTVQSLEFGRLKIEAGGRYEHSSISAKPEASQPQFFAGDRTFDTLSGSVGASVRFGNDWHIGVNLSRTARAPSADELFANGPHAGTEAFEVGDPGFATERSTGIEAVLRGSGHDYRFETSVFYNWFSNFIYEDPTGVVEDGLPIFQFRQANARYYGAEAQASVTFARFGDVALAADVLGDYVHANILNVGPAPRIPPLRVLGGLTMSSPKIDVRGEAEWTAAQNRISAFETPTPGFTLVNAELTVRPWGSDRPLSFLLSANNIFDVTARRHASFLKDYAPLPGRDLRISARVNF